VGLLGCLFDCVWSQRAHKRCEVARRWRRRRRILVVNAWREIPPAERGAATTPIFPTNVVEFTTNTNLALISGSEMCSKRWPQRWLTPPENRVSWIPSLRLPAYSWLDGKRYRKHWSWFECMNTVNEMMLDRIEARGTSSERQMVGAAPCRIVPAARPRRAF